MITPKQRIKTIKDEWAFDDGPAHDDIEYLIKRIEHLNKALKKCADYALVSTNGKEHYDGDVYGFILKTAREALENEVT